MLCHACQQDNRSGARFCEACGVKLARSCAACGAVLSPVARFCSECGQAADGGEKPVAAPAAAPTGPESYTPPHLAQRILTTRGALEGERKQVTVLFCDIAESTRLSQQVGAEAMHGVLNRFFERALEQVHRYEGTVNQFLGDGFMALFGAPLAHEDHARRAVLAALGLRQTFAGGEDGLSVRIGINTGPVVVGRIGDNLRMDYTAVGDTTNLAARLQQHSQPGQTLVGETTWRLLGDAVRGEALSGLDLKGISGPVTAWQLTGISPRRSPLEGLEERALSRFVGRAREYAALTDALEQVQAGRGQVVGIVGEPGVGKSRLLHEFRKGLGAHKLTYLEGRCVSYGKAIPYLPLQEIVRVNCGVNEADSAREIGSKVRVALDEVGVDAEERTPYVLHLLGVKEGAERLEQVGPETIKARIFDTVRQMSLNGARRRPLVVSVEDLHWIDGVSEEYFAYVTDAIADVPILLLTTYRPGYTPPWIDRSFAAQIALRPLTEQDSLSVVESVQARAARLPEEALQRVVAKAEGNPFFLEELTRALLERGGDSLPETIQGVLAARIDRLPEAARRLLQAAAVLGREAPVALVQAVCDDPGTIKATLQILKRAELMHERQSSAEPYLTFNHALTQEVAYDSLLSFRKQSLHELAARSIERLYPQRLEEHYELLAHHYSRSANAERAMDYLELAVDKAMATSAAVQSKAYFDEALSVLDRHPEVPNAVQRRLRLITRHPVMFLLLLKFDEYLDLLRRHQTAVEDLGDRALLGLYYGCLGHVLWWFGHLHEAHRTLLQGNKVSRAGKGAEGVLYTHAILQWCDWYRGDFEASLVHFPKTLAALKQAPNPRLQAWSHAAATWASIWLGRWADAVREAERALEYGKNRSDDSIVSFSLFALGDALVDRGSVADGIECLRQAVHKAPTPADRYWAQVGLGCAQARSGDAREGFELLGTIVPISSASGFVWFDLYIQIHLGWAELRMGRIEPALERLVTVLDPAEQRGMLPLLIYAHRLLGEAGLAMANGEAALERAAAHLEQCIALCERTGAQNQRAFGRAALGRLYATERRWPDARRELTAALEIFERLGTLLQPERVRVELARLPQ